MARPARVLLYPQVEVIGYAHEGPPDWGTPGTAAGQRVESHTAKAKQGLIPLPRMLPGRHMLSGRDLHNLRGPGQDASEMETLEEPQP